MDNEKLLILKGNIVSAPSFGKLECVPNGHLVAEDGLIVGVFDTLPEKYASAHITDCGSAIITQSFSDMHLHAPQYPLLGLGLDKQMLEWLDTYTYPAEARFADADYARGVFEAFAKDLIDGGTTRVSVFSSVHNAATSALTEELEKQRVTGYVGKVNMDRNCPDSLRETTAGSLKATEEWLEKAAANKKLRPIITPRFIPTCSDELLSGLGHIAYKYGLPVQSHLSENLKEIAWVRELCPKTVGYWHAYERHGLLRPGSLMAHCIYSDLRERSALRANGVWAVHCPCSNMDLSSGIMPVRRFVYEGVNVCMGSDIAGSANLFMPGVIRSAVRMSKLNWIATAQTEPILSVAEAFYLATSAGARCLGFGAGFAPGDPLHCIVADDGRLCAADEGRSLAERFERLIYRMQPADIIAVWADGVRVK